MPISVVIQDGVGATPNVEDAELWASELGLTYPVLADVDGEFFPVWDPDVVLPMAYIIDADGVVAWAEAGGSGGLAEMEEEVLALLPEG